MPSRGEVLEPVLSGPGFECGGRLRGGRRQGVTMGWAGRWGWVIVSGTRTGERGGGAADEDGGDDQGGADGSRE